MLAELEVSHVKVLLKSFEIHTIYRLTLSPCAIDSMNHSDCHAQQPPRAPVSRSFSQLLQVHPCSHQYLLHPRFPRSCTHPSSLPVCQHNLFLPTVSPLHVHEKHHFPSCGSL